MVLHITYYFSLSHSGCRNLFQGSVRNRRFKTIYLIIKSLLSLVVNILGKGNINACILKKLIN